MPLCVKETEIIARVIFLCAPVKVSADASLSMLNILCWFLGMDNLIIGTMCKGFLVLKESSEVSIKYSKRLCDYEDPLNHENY